MQPQTIPILSQPVFALSPYCCVLGGESTDTYFKVFVCFTRLGLEATIYCTRSEMLTITPQMWFISGEEKLWMPMCISN
jgi:hypothetical protein